MEDENAILGIELRISALARALRTGRINMFAVRAVRDLGRAIGVTLDHRTAARILHSEATD